MASITSAFISPRLISAIDDMCIVTLSATFESWDHAAISSGRFANLLYKTWDMPYITYADAADGITPDNMPDQPYDQHTHAHTESIFCRADARGIVRSYSFNRVQNAASSTGEDIVVSYDIDIAPLVKYKRADQTSVNMLALIAISLQDKFRYHIAEAQKKVAYDEHGRLVNQTTGYVLHNVKY